MILANETLQAYQAHRFRLQPGTQLKTEDDAVAYINQRGFIMFWPVKEVVMPSLWTATAGNRPVSDEHDDPGHVTWAWKDSLLGKRRCYYGRVLRKRNTFISLEALPYFYALSPNYGDPNEDYLIDYDEGRLTLGAKMVYEALLREGPLDSIALRKAARLTGNDSEFNRALETMQTSFRVLPVGVSQAGAWHYAFVYDIVARYFPQLQEEAHAISEYEARRKLITCYLESVGAAREKDIQRVFGWTAQVVQHELRKLAEQGALRSGVVIDGQEGKWLVSPGLAA
jgi:hypothetical protein